MAARCRSRGSFPVRLATARRCCPATTKPAASPACSSSSARAPRSADRPRSARPSPSPSSTRPRPATRFPAANRPIPRSPKSSPIRRCSPSPSRPRSARTTSSSARRCTSSPRKIPRSPSSTIRRPTKWSGGHGQYGDVVLDIKPLPRGGGFSFEEKITGGVVPRNYIPAVEEGIVDALAHGPLGFPVVDLTVALIDGSYHTVDSSDIAFRLAGRLGIVEALPQCQPVLLEPIHLVEIACPTEATAKINALMSGRRGQILGFDTREGWDGWDLVRAKMPEAEIGDLIVEIRSATAGAGTFTFKFDHMAELTGRTADQIIAARRAAE